MINAYILAIVVISALPVNSIVIDEDATYKYHVST